MPLSRTAQQGRGSCCLLIVTSLLAWSATAYSDEPSKAPALTVAQRERLKERDRIEQMAYANLRAYDDAMAVYEKLAKLAPDEPAYREALAALYARAGRPEDARVIVEMTKR
jgi:Flp pilus assembly protein TadD